MQAKLTAQAQADIDEIITWSERHFGAEAALRYARLIVQAVHDIESDPQRLGVKTHGGVLPGVCSYHLSHSGVGSGAKTVKRPRHLLLFRRIASQLDVLRVLHDQRDLKRHVPPA